VLGVTVLAPIAGDSPSAVQRRLTMEQWTVSDFTITADDRTPAGIDGESVELDPPLRFQTRPAALRVRIAPGHPGASPSALEPEGAFETIAVLARFAVQGDEHALAAVR
jgi:hypothetical protein